MHADFARRDALWFSQVKYLLDYGPISMGLLAGKMRAYTHFNQCLRFDMRPTFRYSDRLNLKLEKKMPQKKTKQK